MSSRYDAAIFDLHGTLIPWSKDGFRAMLMKMADTIGANGDEFIRVMGETAHESMVGQFGSVVAQVEHHCLALGVHASTRSVEQAAQRWFDFHWQGYEMPYTSAFDVLQRLHEMGVKIGIITNCGAEAPELWSRSRFAPLADTAIFSVTEGIAKPDPLIYSKAIKRIGAAPEKCLYVDDSVACLLGAKDAGMDTLLIRHPGNMVGLKGIDEWDGPRITELSGVLNHIT